jgi:uncharacterized membrane protein YhhN
VRAELIWVLPACFALLDWYAVARDDRRTETWAKPLVLGSLIVTAAVLGATETTAGIWLLVALAFGLLGDIALLSDSLPRFKAGVWAFLVGHLAYLVCFAYLSRPVAGPPSEQWMPPWSWAGLAVLAAALFATRGVVPATHRLGGRLLSVPVAVYSVVIGAMLLCAWFTGVPLVAIGATVFVISDATLSIDRFVRPIPHARLILMVTYHVGQALIVAGVLTA